eukprot:COSAG02_NODE_700_length_18341_cov_52.629043_11_plen_166_part_00
MKSSAFPNKDWYLRPTGYERDLLEAGGPPDYTDPDTGAPKWNDRYIESQPKEHIPRENLGPLFDHCDTNHGDHLSESEFKRLLSPLLTNLTSRQIHSAYSDMANGHDGITKQDFIVVLCDRCMMLQTFGVLVGVAFTAKCSLRGLPVQSPSHELLGLRACVVLAL